MSEPDIPGKATVAAGWLPDPKDPTRSRYWDGAAWTSRVIIDDPLDTPLQAVWEPTPAPPLGFDPEPLQMTSAPPKQPGMGAQRLLLGLGGALVLLAVAAFVAFIWGEINPFAQSAILLAVAAGFGASAVRIKTLTGTREVLSVISWGIVVILIGAGPRFGYLPDNWYDLTFAVPATIGAVTAITMLAAYQWRFMILKVVGWVGYITTTLVLLIVLSTQDVLNGWDPSALWAAGLAGAAYVAYVIPSVATRWNHRSITAVILAAAATIPITAILIGSHSRLWTNENSRWDSHLITMHMQDRSIPNALTLILIAALAYSIWRQTSSPAPVRRVMRIAAWALLGLAVGTQFTMYATAAWVTAGVYLLAVLSMLIPPVRQQAAVYGARHAGAIVAFVTATMPGLLDAWTVPGITPALPNTIVGLCGIAIVLMWQRIDARLKPAVWVACAALFVTIVTSVSYLIPGELTLEYLVIALAAPALLAAALTASRQTQNLAVWITGLGSSLILTVGVWVWMGTGSTSLDPIEMIPVVSVPAAIAGLVGWFVLAQKHTWAFWVIAGIILITTWVNLASMGTDWQINVAVTGIAYLIGSLPTRHRNPQLNSGIWLAPAIALMYLPYLVTYLLTPSDTGMTAFLLLLSAGIILTVVGARLHILGFLIPGTGGLTLIVLVQGLNIAQLAPAWVSLAFGGAALLAVGVRMEATRASIKKSARWVGSLK